MKKERNLTNESYLQTVWRRFKRHHLGVVSLAVLVVIGLAALFAPVIAPHDPEAIVGPFGAPPSPDFWLGTDQIGRDMLSRLLYATRVSLMVGILATAISTAVGVMLGLLSGYFGGWLDMVIMRFTDMVMSFPYILLVLVAAAIFEPGLWSIILILGFVDWPGIARLVRGNVLSLRESNFVKSNLVAGMPLRHILFSEILPNTVAPILVYATSVMALSMLDEASLSFLGMGVQPPAASLGNMLNSAQSLTVLTSQPWLWIPPGLLIVILVVAINFAGDALREYFQGVNFAEPQIPVIFNCLGDVKDDSTAIQDLLVKQVQSSVFMEDSIRKMADMGVDAIVEIGPGKALSGFVKKTAPSIKTYAVETCADVDALSAALKG